jgi:hypothetical protein
LYKAGESYFLASKSGAQYRLKDAVSAHAKYVIENTYNGPR